MRQHLGSYVDSIWPQCLDETCVMPLFVNSMAVLWGVERLWNVCRALFCVLISKIFANLGLGNVEFRRHWIKIRVGLGWFVVNLIRWETRV